MEEHDFRVVVAQEEMVCQVVGPPDFDATDLLQVRGGEGLRQLHGLAGSLLPREIGVVEESVLLPSEVFVV